MTKSLQPEEQERPCFVPDEDDPYERELPKCPNLRWEDDDVGPAVSEVHSIAKPSPSLAERVLGPKEL